MKNLPNIYEKIQDNSRPKKIRTLIIAESPPLSGKYFYLPKVNIGKNSLSSTIFLHFFDKVPKSIEEYFIYLKALQKKGVLLIDIVDYPINARENRNVVISEIPNLEKKLRRRKISIKENKIIFLLPSKAYRAYRKHISKHFPEAQFSLWKDFRRRR